MADLQFKGMALIAFQRVALRRGYDFIDVHRSAAT